MGDEFYRIGTYGEAAYFDEWLKIAGINTLPIDENEPMEPETAAMYLTGWLPRVKAALDNTTSDWQGEQPPEKYRVNSEGTRVIAPIKYPLVVTVADKTGVISPGGFRAGCPPEEFMEVIRYIAETCEKVLKRSVSSGQPIEWS